MDLKLGALKASKGVKVKDREVEHEATWRGFWDCCKKYWRQRAWLQKGLMDLPHTEGQVKENHKFQITQVEVLRKLHSHFRAIKNKKYVRKIWSLYNTDDDDNIDPEEMLEIFLDGLYIWQKEFGKRELSLRWVENVGVGHGIAEKAEQFCDFYSRLAPAVHKSIVDNMDQFLDQVRSKMDKDGDGEINKSEFGKSLAGILESLVEWFNESILSEAQNEMEEMKTFAYRAPKIKAVWLKEARNNGAAREKIFVFYWKAMLMDWQQIEQASQGMRGLDDDYQAKVRKAVIASQFRHRGAKTLRSLWRCFKDDDDKGLTPKEFTQILTEAVSAWVKLAPSTTARKWADERQKTPEEKKKFKDTYFSNQNAMMAKKDVKTFAKEVINKANEDGDELIDLGEFRDHFQIALTKFVMDMHSTSRLAGEEAVDGPRKKKTEEDAEEA